MYTIIYHDIRINLNLTSNEYCVLDLIHRSSQTKGSDGWCSLSRQKLSDYLGLSKQTIITIVESLIKRRLVVKNHITKRIKACDAYSEFWKNKFNIQLNSNISE